MFITIPCKLVYKKLYRRAPRLACQLPLGRVRRASKSILHTTYKHSINIYKHNNILLELTIIPCAKTENFLDES